MEDERRVLVARFSQQRGAMALGARITKHVTEQIKALERQHGDGEPFRISVEEFPTPHEVPIPSDIWWRVNRYTHGVFVTTTVRGEILLRMHELDVGD